ncbi:hypothetical protein ACMTN4_07335 [Rhodococcus globerulus]|uniref:hypothetical protein n=1 Tax=Rhodococcus globerulus TaxID=33008 RepID=UPI0039E98F2B
MTIETNIETAALVLGKCAANDPWFPQGGDAVVVAWAEVFAKSGLDRSTLLDGVARAYSEAASGFKPLPADIVRHARATYFEALSRMSDDQRDRMLTTAYELMDMGFPPPLAHKHVRQLALGRPPIINLTDEQRAALTKAVTERLALQPVPLRTQAMAGLTKSFGPQEAS